MIFFSLSLSSRFLGWLTGSLSAPYCPWDLSDFARFTPYIRTEMVNFYSDSYYDVNPVLSAATTYEQTFAVHFHFPSFFFGRTLHVTRTYNALTQLKVPTS